MVVASKLHIETREPESCHATPEIAKGSFFVSPTSLPRWGGFKSQNLHNANATKSQMLALLNGLILVSLCLTKRRPEKLSAAIGKLCREKGRSAKLHTLFFKRRHARGSNMTKKLLWWNYSSNSYKGCYQETCSKELF